MKKKYSVEKLFDPSFDDTLCGNCWYNNRMGCCYKLNIPIPNLYECESFLEDEDIGFKHDEYGEGCGETNC